MLQTHINFTVLSAASTQPKGADIWLLDFSALTENQITNLATFLSSEELTRTQTFKHNPHHFLATRALIRKALAHYTGLPTNILEFSRTPQGKPYLTNSPHPLYFNLSHSEDFAALAVSTAGNIGIDIETIRTRNFLVIAKRYFHADELKQLEATADAEREQLFFKLWTLKEAFFKATGGGISSGLDKACFQFEDKHIDANFAPELRIQSEHWQFQQTRLTQNSVMAIALNTEHPFQCQFFDGNSLLAGE